MNVWLRRLLIMLGILVWLVALLTPTLAFVLARNGQVQIGGSDGRHWRLFLVQAEDAEGLGLERGRPVSPPEVAPGTTRCRQTTVRYWMWAGVGQGVTFCQCIDAITGEGVNITPPPCLTP